MELQIQKTNVNQSSEICVSEPNALSVTVLSAQKGLALVEAAKLTPALARLVDAERAADQMEAQLVSLRGIWRSLNSGGHNDMKDDEMAAIVDKAKTIKAELTQVYAMLQTISQVADQVLLNLIIDTNDAVNAFQGLSGQQVKVAVEMLRSEHGHVALGYLVHALRRGMRGDFGLVKQIDVSVILTWMRSVLEERGAKKKEIELAMHASTRGSVHDRRTSAEADEGYVAFRHALAVAELLRTDLEA